MHAGQRLPGRAGGNHALKCPGDAISGASHIGESRSRERHIGVDAERAYGLPVIRHRHADATRASQGLGGAGVTNKQQLASKIERPHRRGGAQPLTTRGTHADLRGARTHQRAHLRSGISADRIEPDRGTARIVAVKAKACPQVQLRAVHRSKNERHLRTRDCCQARATVACVVALYTERVPVRPQAEHRAQARTPLRLETGVATDAALVDVVAANGIATSAPVTAIQSHGNVVATQLHAGAHHVRDPGYDAHSRELGVHAANGAVIGLIDLIAAGSIVEKVGEVRKQTEVVSHRERINGELAAALGTCPRHRHTLTRGISAEGWVDLSEAPDCARCHRARRDLVGGVPSIRVAQCQHRELISFSGPAPSRHATELAESLRLLPRPVVALGLAADQPPTAPGRRTRTEYGTSETERARFE